MSSGDPLNQRETKAGTVLLVGDKGRKDLILNLRGNTDAVIRHLDHKPVFIAKAGKENLRCPGFKSVPEKIRDGLTKLYRIAVIVGSSSGKRVEKRIFGSGESSLALEAISLRKEESSSASGWIFSPLL